MHAHFRYLAVVKSRTVGGAHYGVRDWLIQRFSAVVMVVYTFILLSYWFMQTPMDYVVWRSLFSREWMRYATLLFALSLFLHAWVGVRDILMDYIKPMAVRLALHILVIIALLLYAMWTIGILWSIA